MRTAMRVKGNRLQDDHRTAIQREPLQCSQALFMSSFKITDATKAQFLRDQLRKAAVVVVACTLTLKSYHILTQAAANSRHLVAATVFSAAIFVQNGGFDWTFFLLLC